MRADCHVPLSRALEGGEGADGVDDAAAEVAAGGRVFVGGVHLLLEQGGSLLERSDLRLQGGDCVLQLLPRKGEKTQAVSSHFIPG